MCHSFEKIRGRGFKGSTVQESLEKTFLKHNYKSTTTHQLAQWVRSLIISLDHSNPGPCELFFILRVVIFETLSESVQIVKPLSPIIY